MLCAFVFNFAKKPLEPLVCFLFPMLRAKSLREFASLNKLFDKNVSLSLSYWYLNSLLIYLVTLMTVLRVPFLTVLQPLRPSIYGLPGYQLAVCCLLGYSEISAMRFWCQFACRSTENTKFIQLLEQLSEKSHKTILFTSKIISVMFTISSYVFGFFVVAVEIVAGKEMVDLIASLFHLFLYFHVARIDQAALMTLYVFAIADYRVISGQMQHLRQSVSQFNPFSHPIFAIFIHYSTLMESVQQFNFLGKVLMLMSKLFVIPLASMAAFMAVTPADGTILVIFKILTLSTAVFYALYGYVLVVVLSQVDTMSKRLYCEINSVIARSLPGKSMGKLQLRMLLEDLGCQRSHVVVREFGGTVTQMDACNSFISTGSLVLLLVAFKNTSFSSLF